MSRAADPEIGEIREELDWTALDTYLRDTLAVTGELSVRQFPNGSANLTYLIAYGAWRAVLRRPPFGRVAPGAHDMRREYRVLSALSQAFDRAAQTLAYCEDTAVLGAPFFVMEYRADGEVVRDEVPVSMSDLPDVGPRLTKAFATAVAELHRIEPDAIGLGDLGRPDGFVLRQLEGWTRRWDAVRPGDPETSSLMDEVGRALATDVPQPQRVSLVHNDLKLDNCQFRVGDPDRVRTIFDWDMTTIGDPLLDLGVMLNYWPDDGELGELARMLWPGQQRMGLESKARLTSVYAEAFDLDLRRLPWYEAMAAWKTAIQLQQLTARFERGESTDSRMAYYATVVPVAARMAARLLDRQHVHGA
ncbi:phosphotransferase family protein [Georgenia sp. SYP-B2076]|uniref:phosphotransferase family protein n=1 Tax=Georgenia sp. SYP-B2076 TaxID=2495881 RepID=UPI000F8D6E9F|nr:phosphotransferase family protein [Georgenia sp. SYP-B2076]